MGSSPSIKQKAICRVKDQLWLVFLSFSLFVWTFPGRAQADEPDSNAIEARRFEVQVLKRSTSKRVLLLEIAVKNEPSPVVGKILLLKNGEEPLLAVRVLKVYPEPGRMAARTVQAYPPHDTLEVSTHATAIEKVGDVTLPPPAPSVSAKDAMDVKDIDQQLKVAPIPPTQPPISQAQAPPVPILALPPSLEMPPVAPSPTPLPELSPPPALPVPEVSPPAPPLGAPPSPEPEPSVSGTPAANPPGPPPTDSAANPENQNGTVSTELKDEVGPSAEDEDDFKLIDPFKSWLSLNYGVVSNSTTYYSAGGGRYGLTIANPFMTRRKNLQDSLVLEGGVFFYSLLLSGGTYSSIPIIGTLRYNLEIGESFSPFLYFGLAYTTTLPISSGATASTAATFTGLGPAVGVGFIFQIGPQWDLRIDLGTDLIDAGLMLRF